MCFGRETNVAKSTSPADTDASLIFKMMKNCKLFEPSEEELDIYDQILDARNYLMHSPNQRIPNEDLERLIGDFNTFLTEFKGNSSLCQRGIDEIQKLTTANILIIDDAKIIQRAFEIQQDAITYDLSVKGRYGVSEYVLQGVLEINEMKYKNKDWIYDVDIKGKEDKASIESLKAEISRLESRISVLIQQNEQLRQSLNQENEQLKQHLSLENEQMKQRLSQENEQLKQRIRDLEKQGYQDISTQKLVREVVDAPIFGVLGKVVDPTTYLCGSAGMTTGAVVGAIGGPPGAIIGAAVGGVMGGIFGANK